MRKAHRLAPTMAPKTPPRSPAGMPTSMTANHAVGTYARSPTISPTIPPAKHPISAPKIMQRRTTGSRFSSVNAFICKPSHDLVHLCRDQRHRLGSALLGFREVWPPSCGRMTRVRRLLSVQSCRCSRNLWGRARKSWDSQKPTAIRSIQDASFNQEAARRRCECGSASRVI